MASNLITQERLKSLLTYDPDTGEFRWRVTSSSRRTAGSLAGCRDHYGYVVIRIDGKLYKAHRLAWLYCYGLWPTKNLDHISQTPDDNRITNLREVDQHENNQNRRTQKNSSSGVTGVSLHKASQRWHARIHTRDGCRSLGYYATKEEAALARRAAEQTYYSFRTENADASLQPAR